MSSSILNHLKYAGDDSDCMSVTIKGIRLDNDSFHKFCHTKRFYERWTADSNFRDAFSEDPVRSIDSYGLKVSPDDVKMLWDNDYRVNADSKEEDFYNVFSGIFFDESSREGVNNITGDPRFRAWKQKQINRCNSQFHPQHYDGIGHFPICFELSKGCSVGCWFCGVSAPKLGDVFFHNHDNAILWRKTLKIFSAILGQDAKSGFCYWATDPLDNPDYEKFCVDFHEELGGFPYTSTAQAWKYPERVRSLISLSLANGRTVNRFSVVSLKVLNHLHQQFTPEELATIELAFQNPESLTFKAIVGKASKVNYSNESVVQSTIACVTGFLVSMVDRTVKLVSPCPANEQWPDGYITYSEEKFSDITELEVIVEKMMSVEMVDVMANASKPKFRDDLSYTNLTDGFQVSTRFTTYKLNNHPYIRELGDLLKTGCTSIQDIISLMENIGLPEAKTRYFLKKLSDKGVLT
jgi:radical SAM family RiPP maturation amino acid epimerase